MDAICEVLIVDDEVLVRQGIKHLLNWESEGFHICGEASDGKEALELVEKLSPHIVITDIVMPLMDGMEFTSILKSRHPNIEVIVLSSFGEFQYVRSSFQSGVADYVLKPKLDGDQLLAILKRTASKIPSLKLEGNDKNQIMTLQASLDKLMSGYEMDQTMDSLFQAFPNPMLSIFGADLKHENNGTKEYWSNQLRNAFEKEEASYVVFQLPTDDSTIMFLLNSSERDWEQLMPIIRSFTNVTSKIQLCWTLSDPFSNIAQLFQQIQNNYLKLKAYRFFLPEHTHLIIRSDLPKLKTELAEFNMNRFTDLLQKRKMEEATGMLFDYVELSSAYFDQEVFAFKTLLVNIIFNITITIGKLEVDTKELEAQKYTYFRNINESTHVKIAVSQLHEFINQMNHVLSLSKQAAGNPNMAMIINYIQEHYMDSISLTDVANYFHFNPSYLSTYFSAHNEEGFSEYLNRVRVNKASELLEQGERSIAEISEMVGYSDHSYFTKVFKKQKGVSPSQYRRMNANRG